MRVIDQREVQKRGGQAARCPVSYVVYSLLSRHGLYDSVLDVTYGRGRFYCYKRPRLLVGADPKAWDWIVEPDIFIPKPVWALRRVLGALGLSFDVMVVDPPAWGDKRYNRRGEYSYAVGSAKTILAEAVKLAAGQGVPYILVHYQETLEGLEVVEDVEFRYVARYLNNPNLRTTHFTLYKTPRGDPC
jgi:hypothetical protein